MKKLINSYSTPLTIIALQYLRRQLLIIEPPQDPSGPNAPSQLVAECDDLLKQMEDATKAFDAAKVQRMIDNARLREDVKKNCTMLVQLAREMRAVVQGNQNHPLYVNLFEEAPSKAAGLSSSYRKILSYTRNVKSYFEDDPQYARFQSSIPDLQSSIDAIEHGLKQRGDDEITESQAEMKRKQIKLRMQDFYNHAYIRLLMAYEGNLALVENCFYPIRSKKKSTENASNPSKEEGAEKES